MKEAAFLIQDIGEILCGGNISTKECKLSRVIIVCLGCLVRKFYVESRN